VPGRRVLLLEDDPGLRRTLARALGLRGWDVYGAADADEAAWAAAAWRPDAVVADLHGTGDAAALARAAHAAGARLVLLSGSGPAYLAAAARRLGAAAALAKPCHTDAVLAALEPPPAPAPGGAPAGHPPAYPHGEAPAPL
jgi:two-component system response regulator RegA